MSALQRARRRIRSGWPHDSCRARRRRVDRQRPEGVDLTRAHRRHGHAHCSDQRGRAEASGHQLDGHRYASTRCGDPPALRDDGARHVQRGVPHRCSRPGRWGSR